MEISNVLGYDLPVSKYECDDNRYPKLGVYALPLDDGSVFYKFGDGTSKVSTENEYYLYANEESLWNPNGEPAFHKLDDKIVKLVIENGCNLDIDDALWAHYYTRMLSHMPVIRNISSGANE